MTLEMKMREIKDEAIEQGIEIGEARGKAEGKAQIIQAIFSKGHSEKEIASLVGLSEQEVKHILEGVKE